MKYAFFLLLFVGLSSLSSSKKLIPVIGAKVPDIELIGVNGKKVKLSSLKGKLVLIDFWASWCGPCRKENPNVVEAYAKYKKMKFKNGKGFEIYSVSLDRDEKAWKEAVKTDKLTWKSHGWDKDGVAAKLYGVNSIPSAFLIDGEQKLIASGGTLRGLGLHTSIDSQKKTSTSEK